MFIKLAITCFCSLALLAGACGSQSRSNQAATQANAPETTSATSSIPPASPANVNGAPGVQPAANSPASVAKGTGFLDACAMLEKAEIKSVQGADVQSTIPSTQTNGGLAISQCYFTVISGAQNLSVHLEVIQPDAKTPNAVKDYWEKSFGEKEKGAGEKEDEESKAPLAVSGVGDEAFWLGSSRAGAVYALQHGRMVRVSVGGGDDQKIKIEKSKKLIANVMKRLS